MEASQQAVDPLAAILPAANQLAANQLAVKPVEQTLAQFGYPWIGQAPQRFRPVKLHPMRDLD